MELRIRKGSRGKIVRVFLAEAEGEGRGKTGLAPDAPGAQAFFLGEGDATPTPISLTPAVAGRFVAGGFREVDRGAMPGLYEIHLPDAALDGSGWSVVVMLRMPGAETAVLDIDLVAYDPYDGDRLGLTCLSREGRHEVITRAFREVVPAILAEHERGARSGGGE